MIRKSFTALVVMGAFVACSGDGLGTDPDSNVITFSVSSPGTGGGGGGAFATSTADPETFTDGTNTLTINSVAVILGELELERTDFVDCETNPDATTCGDFKIGPLLVDVPLGGTAREFAVDVDPGTYYVVEIEIHRVSSTNPDDAALLADHPEMDGQSIRIEGTFNGAPFTFASDLNAFQGYFIEPPITIDETNPSTNVTISFDLDRFFRDQGGMLVNPEEANEGGQYESLVKDNIQDAIRCFEDEDEDGEAT